MPPVAIERRTSSVLVCAQAVSKDKKDKTQVVTNQRLVTSKSGTSSIKGFVKDAISNVKPSLETRKKKIAGITRHVPTIVSPSRGEGLAIRWVLAAAKEKQRKGGKELATCLSDELLDAYLKRGEARQKRDSLHKLAESNRSYVRYRWW
jgi:small subunit ribosomal protein S7